MTPRFNPRRPRSISKAKLIIASTGLAFALSGAMLGWAQQTPTPESTSPTTQATPQRTNSKLNPRPSLTDEQYAKLAADLREAYSKPPAEWPKPNIDPGIEFREIGPIPDVVHPESNPFSKAKSELGRTLFYDARLSGSQQMACVSCHVPDLGWADGRTVAFGNKVVPQKRNTPSILNSAFANSFFWDGRAASLEEQASMPIGNPDEMHSSAEDAAKRIAEVLAYKPLFAEAFGSEEINADRITKAIACFERTLVSGRSKYDAFLRGRKEALSDSAIRGLDLFRTQARCINCHSGPEMSDHKFHNIGLTFYGRNGEDLGRYNVTKNPADVGAFKTPSIRNMTKTKPYMHTGGFEFEEIVIFYNGGGFNERRKPAQKDDPLFPKKSPILQQLHLNKQDIADLEAFLFTLEEPNTTFRVPKVPQ